MAENERIRPRGRRRPGWRSRTRRALRLFGPFLFLGATLALSAGVVRVVERQSLPNREELRARQRLQDALTAENEGVHPVPSLVADASVRPVDVVFGVFDPLTPQADLQRALARSALDDRVTALEAALDQQVLGDASIASTGPEILDDEI